MVEITRKTPKLKYPYYYYFRNFSGICIYAPDTNVFWEQGANGVNSPRYKEHVEWADQNLDRLLKDCQFKILIGHQSPRSGIGRPVSDAIVDFFEKHIWGKFQLVMVGHDHMLGQFPPLKGTHVFISGSGGKSMPDEDKKYFSKALIYGNNKPGFMKVILKRDAKKNISARILALHPGKPELSLLNIP